MDANLIYEKTPSGEEAVRQRTRVVQRNTRMVLILVDGKSSVGELCEKTGNIQLVESALADLERDGLVAPKLDQDSMWEQSKKLAEEIKTAALNRLSREGSPSVAGQESHPLPSIDMTSASPPTPFSVAPQSIFPPQSLTSGMPFSTFGGPPSAMPPPAVAAPPSPASGGSLFGGLFSRKSRRDDEGLEKSVRYGSRRPFVSMPLAVSLGVVGLVALVALVFFLYPYDSHRPDFEATLGRVTGTTVRIGEVRAVFLPRPAIALENVRGKEGSGMAAARIRLTPEIFSLFGAHPVFSRVEVDAARLQPNALAVLPKLLAEAVAPGGATTVREISFRDLSVEALGLSLSGLHADFAADASGKPGEISFQTEDRGMTLHLSALPTGFQADFEALGWRPQDESRFRFDSLQGQARWDGSSLTIQSLDARMFDGAIQGSLRLENGVQPTIAGDLTIKRLSVQRLAAALGYGSQFDGDLAGTLRFSGSAPEWPGVIPSASGEGDFSLQRGALGGFDLVEAMRRGKGTVRGGSTRFDQLSGRLVISPDSIRFADLALASGLLHSGGYLDVARDGKLAGRLDVEMRGSANTLRMPLSATGTLKEPLLQGAR